MLCVFTYWLSLCMSIMCNVSVHFAYSEYYLCKCIWLHVFSRYILCIAYVFMYCMYSKLLMGVSIFKCMYMSMYIMFVSVCSIVFSMGWYLLCIIYVYLCFYCILCQSSTLMIIVCICNGLGLNLYQCFFSMVLCIMFVFIGVFYVYLYVDVYNLYCLLIMCIVYLLSICMFMHMFISMSMFKSCLLYLLITFMPMCIFSVYLHVTFFVLSVLCIL